MLKMLLLVFAAVISKVAGLLFKIPLTALIGEVGMGYFNSAYTLFAWFYMVATSGLPTASAMMISGARQNGNFSQIRRIFHVTLILFLLIGLILSAVMLLGADRFAAVMKVDRARFAMATIAPTLFLICQSAALRGYFQGMNMLMPHALSQVAEALGKLFLGLALAKYALSVGHSVEIAAAYAAFGLTAGVGIGLLVLYISLLFVHFDEGGISDQRHKILAELVKCSLPIAASSGLSSLSGLLDGVLLTRGLHSAGLSQTASAAVWGNYSSLALPMFNLPPVLIYPVIYSLTPELTGLLAAKDIDGARKKCRRAFELTAAVSIPCAVGLAAFAEPILSLFFADDLAERGAQMLIILAPASFLLCLLGVTNTILQSCGRSELALCATFFGILTKILSAVLLIPKFGKLGTPLSTFLCYIVSVGMSLVFIESTELAGGFAPKICLKWILWSGISVGLAVMVFVRFGIIVAIFAAALCYFIGCGKRMLVCFYDG